MKSKKVLDKLRPYFTFGRKKGCTLVFLSQSFYQTDIFIRKQISWLLLCGLSGKRDLRTVLRDVGDIDIETMQRMYEHAKRKESPDDITFLKVCCYEVPLNRKFSRGFLEYLDPNAFTQVQPSRKAARGRRLEYDDDEEEDA